MWLTNIWNKLKCQTHGHHYRPMYESRKEWFSYTGSRHRHTGSRLKSKTFVRYTCECCGEQTKWMTKAQHDKFNVESCPTWGDRGTDSQNYRGEEVYDTDPEAVWD